MDGGGYDRYSKSFDAYTHLVTILFAVFHRFDSIREIVLGMLAESNKLSHLGICYSVKRSTFSDANNRRPCDFFEKVYKALYSRYRGILSDSRFSAEKEWMKSLFAVDSTTISLFSNILKGAGRNPNSGKKKGGIKVHTVIKTDEFLPNFVHFTSAATHDNIIMKLLRLPESSIVAMDRAYVDYQQFEKFKLSNITYVTKAKKNLVYAEKNIVFFSGTNGETVARESTVVFAKGDVRHLARRIEYNDPKKKKPVVLITNDLFMPWEDIVEIYLKRWQIELLFKQLKQNFQLRYFYGESVNAIKSQIWATMIANLLLTVVQKLAERQDARWSFSNLATMVRQMLMYYIDVWKFLKNPEKAWLDFVENERKKAELQPSLFD